MKHLSPNTRLGHLELLQRTFNKQGTVSDLTWRVKCHKCGQTKAFSERYLIAKRPKTCGCAKRKTVRVHKLTKVVQTNQQSITYNYWRKLNRDHPPEDIAMNWWVKWPAAAGFQNFINDMGPKPRYQSLMRKDETKPFSQYNCYWARHAPKLPKLKIGGKYGDLTAISVDPASGEVSCACKCGATVTVSANQLLYSKVTNCGCKPSKPYKRAKGRKRKPPNGV